MCKGEVVELINKTIVFPLFDLTLTAHLRPGHRPSRGHHTLPSLLEFATPTLAPTVGPENTNPRWQHYNKVCLFIIRCEYSMEGWVFIVVGSET
jgi:hypothetical protein